MISASELADKLGRKAMAGTLGVLPTAVSNGVSRGVFPSSWFIAVKHLADREGVDCPPELFGMKAVNSKTRPPLRAAS